jgi:hypothetical protein
MIISADASGCDLQPGADRHRQFSSLELRLEHSARVQTYEPETA